ncbi:MAG: GNAT family N-acetyltransferase [Firmicutes bacterium]|nr:GNAT family N-acetyltransferase [Bacillota bacterium]
MINKIGTHELETERLILRRFKLTDAQSMFTNWCQDHEVTRYLTWTPHASLDVTKELLAKWVAEYDDPTTFRWCIIDRLTKEPIGSIDVVKLDEINSIAVLGWCLSRKFWGFSLMPEAVDAVMKFLFEDVNIHRIEAFHHIDNQQSGRVMQKSGMTLEGIRRKAWLDNNGHFTDLAIYAIIKEDYLRQKGS